jgi:hypothetical protein
MEICASKPDLTKLCVGFDDYGGGAASRAGPRGGHGVSPT